MVFGNMGPDCGTGVAFTRDPSDGTKRFYGEYLMNAQGEDVVAGIRTPLPINDSGQVTPRIPAYDPRAAACPVVYRELDEIRRIVSKTHYKDMQDLEFTIQKEQALPAADPQRKAHRGGRGPDRRRLRARRPDRQARSGPMRVTPAQVDQLLHPMLDPKAQRQVVAKGLPASPGAATGKVVFSSEEAADRGRLEAKASSCLRSRDLPRGRRRHA